MQVTFLGATRSVTGSMHLLEINGSKLLLDCGLRQGKRKEAFEANRNLPFAGADIDAILLSHAHIDHSGNLPRLARTEFTGNIYCTPATRNLCSYMLRDSAHIQEKDVEYVNQKRRKAGKNLFEPLYTQEDALQILKHFVSIDYDHGFEPVPGVRARFLDAGHILGSALVVLDLEENGRRVRLCFTGDLGRNNQPFLRPPAVPEGVDYLIMESTYGNRIHEEETEATSVLLEAAHKAYKHKAKLLIPAFALGRTQQIVYRLNQLAESGELPPLDIYVDSPLAVNLTEVYRLHPECYRAEMHEAILRERDHDPLNFDRLRYVRSVQESRALNNSEKPAIIISASGMCEAGRILHHLIHNIERGYTTVLFVGFQAKHTLGRQLLEGTSRAKIFGEFYYVNADIREVRGFSAHADRNELLGWAQIVREKGNLKQVYLVHGEEENAEALREGLRKSKIKKVVIPEEGESVTLA